jgi:hypothetical protein
MRFARNVFRVAGIYGLLNLLPQYFFEERIGRDFPPPITHPELFYGFLGVAATWQLVYLAIAREPQRLRGMMLLAVVAKSSFGIPVVLLYAAGRVHALVHCFGWLDLAFAGLFARAYMQTPPPGEKPQS